MDTADPDVRRVRFGWVLPSTGDGTTLGTRYAQRPPALSLLAETAQAAEGAGYDFALVPTGHTNNHFGAEVGYLDSLITAAALAPLTRRIGLLVAVRPGVVDAAACARMGATLDLFTGGRFMINLVAGGSSVAMYGERLEKPDRLVRLSEFAQVLRDLWGQARTDFDGRFYQLQQAHCWPKPVRDPPIWFAGSSLETLGIAARQGTGLLLPGMPLERAGNLTTVLRAQTDRAVDTGIHLHVIARATRAEAVAAARELLCHQDQQVRNALGGQFQRADEEWDLAHRTYWWGMRRLWRGAGMAIVGSYGEVAETLQSYVAAGFGTFLVSGHPGAEELRRFADRVLPAMTT